MAAKERRDWTVLVLGAAGQPARRYRINRRALGLLMLVIPLVGLGVGYLLGRSSGRRMPVASIASVAPAIAAQQPTPVTLPAVAVATGSAAAPPPARETKPVNAPPERSGEAAAGGEPLLLLRNASSEEAIEVYPFAADGSPRASAFQLLETAMACASGHHQAPDPALVRVLLEAQHAFGKPLVLLSGRCPRHEDHPETMDYHRAGRAADVRVRGVSTEDLMSWLVKRGMGGAGRYKSGGFVHVDVRGGPLEQWKGEEPESPRPVAKSEPATASPSEPEPSKPPAVPEPAAEVPATRAAEN